MEVHTALVLSVQLIALFSIAGALLLYLLCKVRGSRGTSSNPQVGSILITSADTALGLQLCTFLANKGLKVFAGMKDIDDSLPAKLLKGWMKARECMDLDDEKSYGQILPLKIDVNKEDILREATESIGSYLNAGERGILAVVNTSGSVFRGRIDSQEANVWENMLKHNVLGCLKISRAFLGLLKPTRYINYGEPTWQGEAEGLLKTMETYHDEVRVNFERVLNWLHEYACSRTYGLGTKLPWDEQWLIESLSDSTIYMAFYTVVHLLQNGSFRGEKPSPLGITADQVTPEVWNYIFFNDAKLPAASKIKKEHLELLKREFNYWYPVDLRVSGKDLIQNHLTFFLYNHVAIWNKDKSKWPKGVRTNGHLMLNSMKMSKSDGNFLTLYEAVSKFSADGMRFCLADAGDSVEDANFVESTADAGILRLYTFIEWVKEMISSKTLLRTGPKDTFNDKVFMSVMNQKTLETDDFYKKMLFKEGLRTGVFEFQLGRDSYRELCGSMGGMHVDLVFEFIERQALLLAPICPHVSEHVWSLLGKKTSILHAKWPKAGAVDLNLIRCSQYFEEAAHSFRLLMKNAVQKKLKGGTIVMLPRPTDAVIWVAKTFPPWQCCVLDTMREHYEANNSVLPDNTIIFKTLSQKEILKKFMKRVMPFVQAVRERVELKGGPGKQAMSVTMDFDESEVLKNNLDYLRKSFELDTLEIKYTDDPTVTEKNKEEIRPGCPFISFSVKPFVKVMFENPMPRSGLFSQHLTVSDGDTTKNLKEKLAKSVGLKDLQPIQVWRFEDPVMGPRRLPVFQDHKSGKCELEEGTISIDVEKSEVFITNGTGKKINVGTQFIYILQ